MKTLTKRPRVAQSLTTTLALAFFSLSVVALLISGGLQLFSNFQTQQAIITGNQLLIAQDAARTVSSFIQEKFGVLETSVGLTNLAEVSQAEQGEVLSNLLGRQLAFHHLVLFNTQGQILAQASRLSMRDYMQFLDQLKDIWDQNPQMSRTISPVYIDPVTSEPMVIMTVPVVDVFGDFKGTLLAEVNLKFMWDLIDQLQVGQTGHAYVVDRSGNLIAFGDTAHILRGENVAHLPAVSEFIRNPGSTRPNGGNSYRGITGTVVVGTYVPLGTPDWAVVTELPWAETYRDVIRETVWASGITLAIAALASLLGVYLARRLAAPLINLTSIASRIAGGERELQAVIEGPGEVASLATAFNSMTTQLQHTLEGLEQQIAERKRAEAVLRESEERYRRIVETTHEGVWIIDADNNTAFVNRRMADMLGYSMDEMMGKSLFDFMDEEGQAISRANVERRRQGIAEQHDFKFQRKDGTALWTLLETNPIHDQAGHYMGSLAMVSDITERKGAEEKLKASLQEKEVLLKEIHHRVKNNMQVISSLLYLQADNIKDKQMREIFQESQQRVKSMALIHEQLYQNQDLARIDFVEYVQSLTNHLWQSYGARASHVTLHLDIAPLLLSIETAIPCGLIINELVSNAFKHAFPNGHPGQIEVELHSSDRSQVTLIVKDNGVGLPPDFDLHRCTSLGLTLVNTLVKQLNGTVEVQQARGTEFKLTFAGVTNIVGGENHA